MRLSDLLAICRREMAGVQDVAPDEAEILVSSVTGISRGRLFLSMDDDVGDASVRLFPLIARRGAGEPLQYVLGAWDFFGREFLLSPDTLIPRPETEGLAERAVAALRCSPMARPLALDVGAGSGAIAVTLAAEVPAARIVATDISPGALRKACENAERHGVAARVLPICCDLLSALKCRGRFAVVVSNPPYVEASDLAGLAPEVREWEPHLALSADGAVAAVARGAARVVGPGGAIALEVGDGQAIATAALLEELGFEAIRITTDLAGIDRVVEGRRP